MIISVLNQKGGVGKTTLSVHLATGFAEQGLRVLLADADPQRSVLDWSESRTAEPLFSVIGLPTKTLHRELPKLAADYAHVIIDGPGRVSEIARSAIVASNLVLIPVQPSPYDVWAARDIVKLLDEVSEIRQQPVLSAFVINRKIVNTAIGRDVSEALSEYPIPVLGSHISQRVIFAESAATGQTVLEIDPQSAASQEVRSLIKELQEFMEHGKKGHIQRTAK